MAFGIHDFQDLVRLLEERPEWRAELRRVLLTTELLELPAVVSALAQEVSVLAQAVRELVEAQRRTEARVGGVEGRLDRAEVEFGEFRQEVREAQHRTDQRLDRLDQQVGDLRGSDLERRSRERAGAYFRQVVRRATPLSSQQVVDLIDAPEAEANLTPEERDDILWADLVVHGRRRTDGNEVYLVVEVSAGLDPNDVERAVRRAGLLNRLRPALAAVVGERITPEAEALAETRGVWRVLDGRGRSNR